MGQNWHNDCSYLRLVEQSGPLSENRIGVVSSDDVYLIESKIGGWREWSVHPGPVGCKHLEYRRGGGL